MSQQSNDGGGLVALQSWFARSPRGPRGQGPVAAGVVIVEPVVDRGPGDTEQAGGDSRGNRVAHDRTDDPPPQVVLSLSGEMTSIEGTHTLLRSKSPKRPILSARSNIPP